jgi:hypothetical protein
MKIPVYQTEESINPTASRPANIPEVNPAASGVNVSEAQQKLGQVAQAGALKVGGEVIEHIDRENLYKAKEGADRLFIEASTKLQNKLFSTGTKTITQDNKNFDMPEGLLNRIRTQTDGATEEFDRFAIDLKNEYLPQIKDARVQSAFLKSLDSRILTYRDNVIQHQIKEGNEASKDNLSAIISSEMATFPMMKEEDKLKSIDNLNTRIDEQYKRGVLSYNEAKNQKDDIQDELFRQDTKLYSNEDMANRVKSGRYKWSDGKKVDTALSTLNHYKELADKNTLINKIDNRFNLVDAISQGKEDIYNLSKPMQILVDNDEILSAAISKARQSAQGYLTDTTEAENYVKVFDEASKATDRDSLSTLAASMIYRDKTISPDKMGLVLFYASQSSKNKHLSKKILEPIGNETTADQIQALQLDAGINAISRWSKEVKVDVKEHSKVIFDYLDNVRKGASPRDSLNLVINNANLRLHTGMSGYPKEGQLLQDKYGNRAIGMPDGSVKPVAISKPKAKENKESKPVSFEEL